MKKRYVVVLLVAAFVVGMMAGGIGLADNEQVNVWINGERLISSPGPQLIDGRVFVPLRAVSESMGANVGWDGFTNTAYIATQRDALTDIEIVGDASFQKAMRDALKLLKDKDPEDYKFVGMYVRKIILDDNMRAPGTQGYNMEIHIPADYDQVGPVWWAAGFVHETTHINKTYNIIKIPLEQEELEASTKQKYVLKKLNAPQWMTEYVDKEEKEKWWEQSPEKNSLLEQILNQLSQQN